MYPLYQRYKENLELGRLDKAAGVATVGAGEGSVQPLVKEIIQPVEVVNQHVEPTAGIPDIPPACIEKIDAVFHWTSDPEYIYIFAGSWYYRLVPRSSDSGNLLPVLDGSVLPKRIGLDGFFGFPRNIDAAVESPENFNKMYAFKGSKYYIYDMLSRKVIKEGSLSELWPVDTPDKIDGALQIDPQTLGFLVEDKLYEYKSDTGEWRVGCDGSNYFRKFVGVDSLSVGFVRGWTWIFQGAVSKHKKIVKEACYYSNYILLRYEPAHATMGQVVFSGFEIIEKNFPIFTGYVGSSNIFFRGLGIRLAH